jgi:DtxR family transcriptional regulator, Mn-dependent transcriptional regulator
MDNPLLMLLSGCAVLFFAAALFWPGKGIIPRRSRLRKTTIRVLIEDALKHLYNCEYTNVSCTIYSIAGSLNISGNEAANLISKLEGMGLIKSSSEELQLTPEGRSYALRVIRVHRLLERYLADETNVSETEWHSIAEEREHAISPEQAEILAAQLGNPIVDPHGDPIPSASGQIPKRKGVPLTLLKEGESATIVHIEDEPKEIYAQLIAEGLCPGIHIRIIESTGRRIKFSAENEECILAPSFASCVTVFPIPKEKESKAYITLSKLKSGKEATVIRISNFIRGQQRRRLMDFGIVPGTKISAEFSSLGNDPVAYKIRGAVVALRKNHTDHIFIKE